MSAPVDVLAVLRRIANGGDLSAHDGHDLNEAADAIAGLIGVADEAYAELLADSHRDGPRCSLLTRLEAALRAVGGAE